MDKDEIIKQQQREIERYKILLEDGKDGLEITDETEMSTEEILTNLFVLSKQANIKSFWELSTLHLDLNKIPGNKHIYGFRSLFRSLGAEIDECDDRVLTVHLRFRDNYKNVIKEMLRQAEEDNNKK